MESTPPKTEEPQKEEDPLLKVLVDKTKRNSRGVPTMNFIDDVEEWINKYTAEKLISYLNQYLNKYKYMDAQISKTNQAVQSKVPDIEKCLETIDYFEKKEKEKPIKVDYMVSNNLWAKAEVNVPDSVFLWLGANIMCEYKMEEAKTLLNQNLNNAKVQVKKNVEDLEFTKDQITVCEVNIARVYNETVRRNAIAQQKKAGQTGNVGTSAVA